MEKFTGTRPTGKQLTILRSKIGDMFSSKDISMNKLAQKLCHLYRINYWMVIVQIPTRLTIPFPKKRNRTRVFYKLVLEANDELFFDTYRVKLKRRKNERKKDVVLK